MYVPIYLYTSMYIYNLPCPFQSGGGSSTCDAALEQGTCSNCEGLSVFWVNLNLWDLTTCCEKKAYKILYLMK